MTEFQQNNDYGGQLAASNGNLVDEPFIQKLYTMDPSP